MRKSAVRPVLPVLAGIVIGAVLAVTVILLIRGAEASKPQANAAVPQQTEIIAPEPAETLGPVSTPELTASPEPISYDAVLNPVQDAALAPSMPADYSQWTEDQKTRLNLFLSNFSEVYMPSFTPTTATGAELLWYVERHLFINNNSEISYSDDGTAQRFSNVSAQNCLDRYFGVSLEPKDYSGTVCKEERSYKYIDGYFCNYRWGIGEAYNRFTIVSSVCKNSDGTFTAEFDVYEQSIDEYQMRGLTRDMYALRPDTVMQHVPAVTHRESGTAVVRPYTKNDGGASYQLVSYSVAEDGTAETTAASDKKAEFAARADAIHAKQESSANSQLTNVQMKEEAAKYCEKWDALLNEIYLYLQDTLSEDEFELLKADELRWIDERDVAMDSAEMGFRGGTGAGLARLAECMRLTEERVYALLEMLP